MKEFQLIQGSHDLSFVEQLRIFIARQGWTIEDLAKRLSVTGRQGYSMMTGKARITDKSKMILYVLKDNPNFFDDVLGLNQDSD